MPWPAANQRYQASTQGGTGALWSRDSQRLFYAEARRIVSVDVSTEAGGRLRAGAPKTFIDGRAVLQRVGNYDVAADGRRMVVVEGGASATTSGRDLRVVFNWVEELKRKLPQR